MRASQITPYLWLLRGWMPVNTYLVKEPDGFTLIDAGLPWSGKSMMALARKLGGEVRRVTLTHAHLDHVGALDELMNLQPSLEFTLSEREARIFKGDKSLLPGEVQKPLRGNFARRRAEPSRTLRSGDRVGSLEVVETPGHTPGHIAFLDTRDGSLVAGDSWQTLGGLAVSGQLCWKFPFPAWATWDPLSALRSALAMIELKPRRLAVGHGPWLEDPLLPMKEALRGL